MEEGTEFMYDPADHQLVRRFLGRIQYVKKRRNLSMATRMSKKISPDSPYRHINRTWQFAEGEGNFFQDVLCNELQLMDSTLAAILAKVTKTIMYHVTPERLYSEGKSVLGIDGIQVMITDGLQHEFDRSPILFDYLESPPMYYMAKQRMDASGNWT